MVAAPPAHVVVLAHAIGGIPLGAARASVRGRLGAGVVVRSGRSDFGPFVNVFYPKASITVSFVQGIASSIDTSSGAYPTRQGIAVGDSTARLRATYGVRLHCSNDRTCMLGEALPGHAVTTFQHKAAVVVRIAVAAVLD